VSRVRRTIQWTAIGAIALFLVGTAYCSSLHLAEVGPALGPSHQLLTLLTLAIVVLSTGVVFVLVRNLVRLIVDRKRGILGAKLRT
jgi:nitrogen fixation/metabolism regulation signal transduction histidine kinase